MGTIKSMGRMLNKNNREKDILPFIKWMGGKTRIAEIIIPHFPKNYENYFEPFIGGGAILLKVKPKKAIISDLNSELINLWKVVQEYPSSLIKELEKHQSRHSQEYYYQARKIFNQKKRERKSISIQSAGIFLYLNKTGFNHIYRENKKGEYNVPMNKWKMNLTHERINIMKASQYLWTNEIEIISQDYKEIETTMGDFVYLDPPYDETFNEYNSLGFSQVELKEFCDRLTMKGVKWLQSNNDTPYIRKLYQNYYIQSIEVNRMFSSKQKDVIITNCRI